VRAGDLVLARDEKTGEIALRRVVQTKLRRAPKCSISSSSPRPARATRSA
jgi:hypothetical protein